MIVPIRGDLIELPDGTIAKIISLDLKNRTARASTDSGDVIELDLISDRFKIL